MTDHVDIVLNVPDAAEQRRVAIVVAGDVVKVETLDAAFEGIVPSWIFDEASGDKIFRDNDPGRFMVALPYALNNPYVFATLHPEPACPFEQASSDVIPMTVEVYDNELNERLLAEEQAGYAARNSAVL